MRSVLFLLILVVFSIKLLSQDNQLKTGFYSVVEADSCKNSNNYLIVKSTDEELCINKYPVITENDFESVKIMNDTTDYGINYTIGIKLDSSAIEGFKEATSKLVGQRLALIVNNKIISAPVLRDPIVSGEIAVFCDKDTINEIKAAFRIK